MNDPITVSREWQARFDSVKPSLKPFSLINRDAGRDEKHPVSHKKQGEKS
jgi:hypothetical protein